MEQNKNSRRQFLRNTTLAALSASVFPTLSKALGKTTTVDAASCNPTTLDYYGQGPFYTAGAPVISNNQLASSTEPGTRLILSGVVQALNCSSVIPNTKIDIWHANDAGQYDNTGFNLRGVTYSNAQGFYQIETILPGKYLNGSSYRPRHLHFRITPPGFPTIITQTYFQGDTDIPGDAAASITSGTYDATHRIIPITLNSQSQYVGTWDIVVNGPNDIGDMPLDKGIIYATSPNPFTDRLEINYGVFQKAKILIQVFNLNGAMVAELDEQHLAPQKYTATWIPHKDLPSGTYFITLKMNGLQVHYLKVIKE